jgi:hypothetical protein
MSVRHLFSSTASPEGGRERLSFEIGEDIRLFLSPSNIQINSPYRTLGKQTCKIPDESC